MTVKKSIDFEQFLQPEQLDDFIGDYFQKRQYVLRRDDPHFYDGLISPEDVMSLAFSTKTPEKYHQRWLELTKEDKKAPASILFNENGIIPAQILTHYQQGYSVIVNYLEMRWPPITLLCKNFEKGLTAYAQPFSFEAIGADIFLTPPDAQAFLPHYDMVDAFILQLEGSKQWSIYNQLERFPSQPISNLSREMLGDPVQTLCLNPGDMLYIPAGYPHEASTIKGHSLHLSVTVTLYRWKNILSNLLPKDEDTHRTLPLELPDTPSATIPVEQLDGASQQLSSSESRVSEDR
jgi:ribosomal protein L16 Arg81 hydroxylase